MHIYIVKEHDIAETYGIGTYVRLLLECLSSTSYKVHVIELYSNKNRICTYKEGKIDYIFIPRSEVDKGLVYYRNAVAVLRTFIVHKEKILFHLNFMMEERLALELKRAFPNSYIVLTVHYSLCGMKQQYKQEIIQSEKTLLSKYCDKVIAVSKYRFNQLIQEYDIAYNKISLIPHGVKDMNLQMNIEEKMLYRSFLGLDNEKIILFVGRSERNKGLKVLLEAFFMLQKKMSDIHLVIVGDNDISGIFETIKYKWRKVTFMGYLEYDELLKLYQIADIGVIPSYYEELGYVALEMSMFGIPVIANKTTGLNDVFSADCGVLVDLYSVEEPAILLAMEMEELLSNRDRCREIGKNARNNYLERFSYSSFCQKILAFLWECELSF